MTTAPVMPINYAAPSLQRVDERGRGARASALSSGFAFGLLLGLVVVLFLRPAELLPFMAGWPIYQALILGCILLALPVLLAQIFHPLEQPVTTCVVGLLFAVVVSHLSHGFIWGARHSGPDFAKLAIFYLLVVGIVTNEQRLRTLLVCISFCILLMTVLSIWGYYGVIDLPALQAFQQQVSERIDPATGQPFVLLRLCGAGIFNDPNDFCLVLIFGMMLSLWRGAASRSHSRKLAGLLAAGLFVWALSLTHSRGGFIAMLAAILTLAVARGGLLRATLFSVPIIAGLFLVFAGRQTEISASEGTGLSRLQLWSEALRFFKTAPLFGIGMDQFHEYVGLDVHNSFLHCFVELGIVGGTLFLGAFVLAGRDLLRLRKPLAMDQNTASDIVLLRPYLLASLVAYAVGYMSLSRSYSVPTYLVLALAVVYSRIVSRPDYVTPRFGFQMLVRLTALSIMFLVGSYVFIRVFVRWS